MATLLKGKPVADAIKGKLLEQIKLIQKPITLGVIRIGQKTDDLYYEQNIQKTCLSIGMHCKVFEFDKDITQEQLVREICCIAQLSTIHGLLMFSPLPTHLDSQKLKNLVPPEKDIDGLNVLTAGELYIGNASAFPPCTAAACLALLKFYNIPLQGKRCVIIGRSLTVGKPLGLLLLNENATVTICHSKTLSLPQICQQADILIAAIGHAKMITPEFAHANQTILDVGINPDPDHPQRYCGDINFEQVAPLVKNITPVPGGIGSITTAILCQHTLMAYQRQWLTR